MGCPRCTSPRVTTIELCCMTVRSRLLTSAVVPSAVVPVHWTALQREVPPVSMYEVIASLAMRESVTPRRCASSCSCSASSLDNRTDTTTSARGRRSTSTASPNSYSSLAIVFPSPLFASQPFAGPSVTRGAARGNEVAHLDLSPTQSPGASGPPPLWGPEGLSRNVLRTLVRPSRLLPCALISIIELKFPYLDWHPCFGGLRK